MPHGLWNLGRICRIDCGSLLYATWIAEFRRRASHVENLITVPLQPPRHNVPHPIPKHTDKSQHRITHHNPRTPKKKPEGCAEGRGLVPLCGFLTFQCDLPSAGFRSPCGIQQGAAIYAVIRPEFRNPCGIYGRDSAIHAGIRPGPPQPMRLLFPHTKFRKYLINKVFPK